MSGTASNGQSERPASSSRVKQSPGSDSASRVAGGVPLSPEEQATVISHRPPLAVLQSSDGRFAGLGVIGPGSRLGQFEVLGCVGGGGMGRVYRALDTALGRTVALKVLSPEQAADTETLLRFRNEARSAARLNHNNIVQVYHVGEEEGLPYIVFEFIEGSHLRALVERKGPLPLAEAISYTFQVAEALAHAAARNVVHRDIKPSNVLVTPDGVAKLIDMGLARLQRLGDGADDLTASGVTLGTFDYISPEQARDPRSADVRSDLYSLGCTLFYMLTGRPPFPQGTVLQKLLQHQGDEPPDVRASRPDLPEEVSRVVRKMMAKDPRHRYQTPLRLMDALARLAEQVGLRPIGPGQTVWTTAQDPPPSALERHLPWAVPIAALLLIVLGLHVLWSAASQQSAAWSPAGLEGVAEPWRPEAPADAVPALPERLATGGAGEAAEGPSASPVPTEKGPASAPKAEASDSAVEPGDPALAPAKEKPVPEPRQPDLPAKPPAGAAPLPKNVPAAPVAGAEAGESPAKRSGVLVVDGAGQSENTFATLAAACGAAATSAVVELCYNGRMEERPIALGNLKLTVRAGDGFQPIVVFRPSESDPLKYPRSMFTLSGTRLTLINMAIELDVPREIPADSWSLFDVGQAESVRLEKCVLTIRNASEQQKAYHQEVAFFRVTESPEALAAAGQRPAARRHAASISLADTVARGEAAFLRTYGVQPAELVWDNGLLATTERLLTSELGESAAPPEPTLRLSLKHLTALVRSGLCRLDHGRFAQQPLGVEINCADSIVLGNPGAPLLEQVGSGSADQFRQRITWTGDRNFYPGWTTFWSLQLRDADDTSESMAFDAWLLHWGAAENNVSQSVEWKQLPPADRPPSAHIPADYTLSDSATGNPARRGASDGRDAGMDLERLRGVPERPAQQAKPAQSAGADGTP